MVGLGNTYESKYKIGGEEKINTKCVWKEANIIFHGNTSLFHHLSFLFDVLFCLQWSIMCCSKNNEFKSLWMILKSNVVSDSNIWISNRICNFKWFWCQMLWMVQIFGFQIRSVILWWNYDALPSSLMDSNGSLKWKQQKSKDLGARSLACNTLGGKGASRAAPGWD